MGSGLLGLLNQIEKLFLTQSSFGNDCQEGPTLDLTVSGNRDNVLILDEEDMAPPLSYDAVAGSSQRFHDFTPREDWEFA